MNKLEEKIEKCKDRVELSRLKNYVNNYRDEVGEIKERDQVLCVLNEFWWLIKQRIQDILVIEINK